MEDGDGAVTTTTDSDRFEVACSCLNIRCVVRRVGDDAGGEAQVELDEEGGALRVVGSVRQCQCDVTC